MSGLEVRDAALRASLHWYEIICGAHGSRGVRNSSFWMHPGEVPPYHSRWVSLAVDDASTQIAAIRGLIAEGRAFTLKDSFQCLELGTLGFEELFRASWIARSAGAAAPVALPEEPRWEACRTGADLELWERIWRGVPDNILAREAAAVFPARLLDRTDMAFSVGYRGDEPVATAALNATSREVGLSNVFSTRVEKRLLFGSAARFAGERFPGLVLVGYERGESLAAALAAEFENVGGLTVWSWQPQA